MRRHSGQKVVCFYEAWCKSVDTSSFFAEKAMNRVQIKKKIFKRCEKFAYLRLRASRLKFYYGHLPIVAKRSCIFSSTAFQLILTLVEISRFLVSL